MAKQTQAQERRETLELVELVEARPEWAVQFHNQETISGVLSYWRMERPKMMRALKPALAKRLAKVLVFLADEAARKMGKVLRSEADLMVRRDLMVLLYPESEDEETEQDEDEETIS